MKKFHSIRDKRVEAKKAIPKVEMDARKRADPRSAMAGAMMSLSGAGGLSPSSLDGLGRTRRGGRSGGGSLAPGYLWDAPYGPSMHPQYPGGALDGYAPHFHPAASPHYGPVDWMSGQANANGPYGFRGPHGGNSGGGAYGRNGYPSQATAAAAAAAAAATAASGWPDYGSFPAASSHGGGIGPMRLAASYQHQHRGYRPYANGSSSSSSYGSFSSGAGSTPRRSHHP